MAPMEYVNQNKELTGFSVEYMAALAQEMGVDYKFVDTNWENIFSDLLSHKCDIILSSVSITPERQTMMEFSHPYLVVNQILLVKAQDRQYKFSQLQGKQVGLRQFSTSFYYARELQARPRHFTFIASAVEALLNDQIDAVLCDSSVTANLFAVNPQYKGLLAISDHSPQKEYYGIAVSRANPRLLERVNQAISALKAKGIYAQLLDKWLGSELASAFIPD